MITNRVTNIHGDNERANVDNYLAVSDQSSLYHDMKWGEIIERCFKHKTYYLISKCSVGKVNGLLPIVHLNSILFGNFMVSMPYVNYGGVCADNDDVLSSLIQQVIDLAGKAGAEYIEFRQERELDKGFPVKTSKVSMRLELPETSDELWKSFSSKLRSQIRRPQKEGMTIQIARHEELENFYRIFSINMRDLGTPVYSKSFFENILEKFPENTWICSIYKEKQAVASGFLAGYRDKLEIPWASSIRKFNRLSPNMLLYWSSLEFATERGFTTFDFGRSTPGEGTYKFKEQWGAKPTQLYWYYWLRDGNTLPDLTTKNPKYQVAIKTWKKLPVSLTKIVGPHIVKYIP